MSFNFILLSTGIFNILNGIIFKLPMPLQPMKAIVAEAITKNIDNLYVICSVGLVVGGIVFTIGFLLMIGLTNEKLQMFQNRLITRSLISGIQVGLGLGLCKTGARYIQDDYVLGVPMFCMMLLLMGLSTPVKRKVHSQNCERAVVVAIEEISQQHIKEIEDVVVKRFSGEYAEEKKNSYQNRSSDNDGTDDVNNISVHNRDVLSAQSNLNAHNENCDKEFIESAVNCNQSNEDPETKIFAKLSFACSLNCISYWIDFCSLEREQHSEPDRF